MISLSIPQYGLQGFVPLPFSKSISNRQLILGAHSGHPFTIQGLSEAEDTQNLLHALRQIGYEIHEATNEWRLCPPTAFPPSAQLFVGEGGTTLRFLLPLLAHLPVTTQIEAAPSLRRRPLHPLLHSLIQSGAKIEPSSDIYPLKVAGNPDWRPQHLFIDSTLSSQFLSALLLLAPHLATGSTITELSLHPATPAYRNMTHQLLRDAGYDWQAREKIWYLSNKPFRQSLPLLVGEADWSAASYFFGWAALGAFEGVLALSLESLLPERELFTTLCWGYKVTPDFQGLKVSPTHEKLAGIECDIENYPDAVLVLAVVAAFAESPSCFRGIQTLPHKESDRLYALSTELNKVGATLYTTGTDLIVEPVRKMPKKMPVLDSYGDHRVAMALSLIAARSAEPIRIREADCVRKSFPHYWEVLRGLGAQVQETK
ncbi:MAG: hypothetical protein N2200_05165 [Bacteroidia bacterium]|nr:hypothetical protein [Bacteroidia bacterium]